MSVKFLVKSLLHNAFSLITWNTKNRKQNDLYNALSKSAPTMYTLVEELYNSYD